MVEYTRPSIKDIELKPQHRYNGYPTVKRAGVELKYSMEQIQEIIKCKQDPIYFIRNYIFILSLDKGLTQFDLYDYQEEMIRACVENRHNIFLMGRQLGKCVTQDTKIKIKNKKTGEIRDVNIGEFFEAVKTKTEG